MGGDVSISRHSKEPAAFEVVPKPLFDGKRSINRLRATDRRARWRALKPNHWRRGLETLLRLLGPPSERQRSDLKRATDIVLVEDSHLIYWPRTGELFADAAYALARVQATLAA